MSVPAAVTVSTGVSNFQFDTIKRKLHGFMDRIKDNLIKAASLVKNLSPKQLQEIKDEFRGALTADQVEKLVLLGRGIIKDHLLVLDRTITAQKLMAMPAQNLAVINNPHRDVKVWSKTGVVSKEFGQLTPIERRKVMDTGGRFRTPEAQKRWFVGTEQPKRSNVQRFDWVFDGLEVDGDCVNVFGRDSDDDPGTRRVRLPVPRSALEKLLK